MISMAGRKKIFIGADHRGFQLKEQLKQWLQQGEYLVEDVGAYQLDQHDDYPIISEKLGIAVAASRNALGILLCGSGVGASAAVNKVDGIRGGIGVSPDQVRAGRHDDNMNVLILAADGTDFSFAKDICDVFLTTPYAKEKRYERRLKEIRNIEKE